MWHHRQDGDLYVQYSDDVKKFGWDKLKEIALAAKATGSIWDEPGDHQAEINTHMGVQYIAFMVTDPEINKVVVIVESRKRLERVLKTPLVDMVRPAHDGQHRHGAKFS